MGFGYERVYWTGLPPHHMQPLPAGGGGGGGGGSVCIQVAPSIYTYWWVGSLAWPLT